VPELQEILNDVVEDVLKLMRGDRVQLQQLVLTWSSMPAR